AGEITELRGCALAGSHRQHAGHRAGADGFAGDEAVAEMAAQGRLLDLADGVFADWQRIMVSALRREGVAPARARRPAALGIAAPEGTVAMCRGARSAQPLEDVRQELELVLSAAIAG